MKNITSIEELKTIVSENKKVIIDFHAPWCGPCRMLGPVLEKLENEYTDITVIKVNVDEVPEAGQVYEVNSIPDVRIYKDGNFIEKFVGIHPASKYVELLS